MIEILLIKGSNVTTIAKVCFVNTWYTNCDNIVYGVAKSMYRNDIVVDRIKDSNYPIAYRIDMNNDIKIVAKDIDTIKL